MTTTIDKLNKIGGKEWKSNGHHRFYFSEQALIEACVAQNNGSERVRQLAVGIMRGKKVWFDFNGGQIETMPAYRGRDLDYINDAIANINKQLEA